MTTSHMLSWNSFRRLWIKPGHGQQGDYSRVQLVAVAALHVLRSNELRLTSYAHTEASATSNAGT